MSDPNEIELTSSLQYSFFSPKIGLNQGSHLEPWLWGKILNKVEFGPSLIAIDLGLCCPMLLV